MFARILTVATNAYREAARSTVLHGILLLAAATTLYSIVLGTLSLHQELRVVADIGAASSSLYAAVVVTILGATALHREIEMKTIFPVLTRRLRRHEYMLGKYTGLVLTAWVFLALHGFGVLTVLALQAGRSPLITAAAVSAAVTPFAVLFAIKKRIRVFLTLPLAVVLVTVGIWLAGPAGNERRLVCGALVLSGLEVLIIAAIALFFSSFSTGYLTAMFTTGVFVSGRSTDTMAHIPVKYFGEGLANFFKVIARILPNLNLYVPPRPVLLGLAEKTPLWPYVGLSALYAVAYAAVLVALSTLIFQRRDFP